ncbi:hypothetical protein [Desulfobacter sp.]|uniref:hypothetical protein n=1 Tax=Desulfobacter sp. TaxID=2294 RepID=UPI003D10EB1A
MKTEYLKIRNWEKWQSYRKDRGQPPWIKIHRCVMRNPEWVSLSDAERGQLVAIWLLAADNNGTIPASPVIIRKLCYLDNDPDINKFIELGFICEDGCQPDASLTPTRRQHDSPETETETETERERDTYCSEQKICSEPEVTQNSNPDVSKQNPVISIPLVKSAGEYPVSQEDLDSWQDTYPCIDVRYELKQYREWALSNPKKRKTAKGIRHSLVYWLSSAQDRSRSGKGGGDPSVSVSREAEKREAIEFLNRLPDDQLKVLFEAGNSVAGKILEERTRQ